MTSASTHRRASTGQAGSGRAVKVAPVVALFWVTKLLTTAFGESTSDWLVHALAPPVAVLIGFVAFAGALTLQLHVPTYSSVRYWLAVAMVGVFGTMAADVLHVGLHVPYVVSAAVFAVALAAVFLAWHRVEGTVSVHSITTRSRELFYWAAVVVTFALGTAVGDLLAATAHLGYLVSALVFLALICVPAALFRFRLLGATAAFWTAYVLTRPLGASIADWLGKGRDAHGLGIGSGFVALVLGGLIVCAVGCSDAGEGPAAT